MIKVAIRDWFLRVVSRFSWDFYWLRIFLACSGLLLIIFAILEFVQVEFMINDWLLAVFVD